MGKLSSPKLHEKYETGQFFLHRIFGYRGVILFPWRAKVFDRSAFHPSAGDESVPNVLEMDPPIIVEGGPSSPPSTATTETKADDNSGKPLQNTIEENPDNINGRPSDSKKEVTVKVQTYYQVLVDSRDCPHVVSLPNRNILNEISHKIFFILPNTQRAQTEAVTFLSHQKNLNRNLYAIPGLDYVSHEDVIPYSVWNRDRKPLKHELFEKFLVHTGKNAVSFKASELLHSWQERNHPWLELTEVHREITENIRVTVIPFYMGSRQTQRTPVHWVSQTDTGGLTYHLAPSINRR